MEAKNSFSQALTSFERSYFQSRSKYGNYEVYTKAILGILGEVSLYYVIAFAEMHWALTMLAWALSGITKSFIGFNVMHDTSHGSFSKNRKVDILIAHTLSFTLGAFSVLWLIKHVRIHHVLTNIEGRDDDIDTNRMIRVHYDQPWEPKHKHQSIYAQPLYGLLYPYWVYYSDFKKYFKGKIQKNDAKLTFVEHILFWASKITYLFLFWFIPLQNHSFWMVLAGNFIMGFVCGIFLANIFQLAHVNGVSEFRTETVPQKDNKEWQARSTANFATDNNFLTWFIGGLNFQIEHHLFPHISHRHYRGMQAGVKKICEEYNIPYTCFPSFREGYKKHREWIKELSIEPNAP
jgi:linoleoyl-CoA desaturase